MPIDPVFAFPTENPPISRHLHCEFHVPASSHSLDRGSFQLVLFCFPSGVAVASSLSFTHSFTSCDFPYFIFLCCTYCCWVVHSLRSFVSFPWRATILYSPAVLAAVKSKTLPIKVQNQNQNRILERVSNSPTAIHRATINRFSLFAANQTPLLHINLIS